MPPDPTAGPAATATVPGRPPAEAEAGPAAGRRPRRVLALEGLVVYLVLQALTVPVLPALRSGRKTSTTTCCSGSSARRSTAWPGCCARGSCRSG